MILKFKKGHKKAYIISIINLYSIAMLWIVSGAISFSFVFSSYLELFYFVPLSIFMLCLSILFQNRNPLNLYIEYRNVIISKSMGFLCLFFLSIFFLGERFKDGVDYIEISSLIFSLITMSFFMTFLFKTSHSEKWYENELKNDHSHLAD